MTNLDMFIMNMKADKLSENTISVYIPVIKEMLLFVNKPENEIKYLDLKMWQSEISNASSATVARKITTVRSYFKFLKDAELIDTNPSLKLKSPHITNKERDFLPYEQAIKMLDNCNNSRERAMLAVYLSTGLRVAEICNIKFDQYMQKNIIIKTKGNKYRTIYLNEEAKKYIDEYLKDRKSDCEYLFVSNQHTQMNRASLNKTIKKIAKKSGISQNVSNHTFRHSFCTKMCDEYGIATAQKIIGHSSPNITARYCHDEQGKIENIMTGIKLCG